MQRAGVTGWWLAAILLAGVMLGASGCRIPHRVGRTVDGMPEYKLVHVVYERVPTPADLTAAENSSLLQAGFQDEGVIDLARLPLRLELEYPAPGGAADEAALKVTVLEPAAPEEATPEARGLIVAAREAASEDESESVGPFAGRLQDGPTWTLSISRVELDLLLLDLANSGFFEEHQPSTPTTEVDVQIDRGRFTKVWMEEPRLEHFVRRAIHDGLLALDEQTSQPGPQTPIVPAPAAAE
ncbi:hypothetical protein Mal4_41400 [Maioricimonas rarisocia]|uniref:Lipoprotein n=1 Tax=Maioricimonas rarisocia TaxID=2528026 RepID=A0A517ZBC3_9PLAN|nr:hypothetical protein [Maioricimonas rarisocia]QDU39793.1 hypothetical protein Mal4_41400 [Maioricimonas rarisocia]